MQTAIPFFLRGQMRKSRSRPVIAGNRHSETCCSSSEQPQTQNRPRTDTSRDRVRWEPRSRFFFCERRCASHAPDLQSPETDTARPTAAPRNNHRPRTGPELTPAVSAFDENRDHVFFCGRRCASHAPDLQSPETDSVRPAAVPRNNHRPELAPKSRA